MAAAPMVSIICIAYNHEKSVGKTIEGFLSQKVNFPIEIIIHEDASTDNTAQVIRKYVQQHPAIFRPIFQKENQYSKARGVITNIVLEAVRGKYIAFCEGDDYWTDPYKLQKQVNFLEGNPDFNICSTRYVKKDIELGDEEIRPKDLGKSEFDFMETEAMRPYHTCTTLFRNNFTLPGWFIGIYPGDKFLIAIAIQDKKLKLLPDVTAVYNRVSTGMVKSTSTASIERWKELRMAKIRGLKKLNEHTDYRYKEYFEQRIQDAQWKVERKVNENKSFKGLIFQKQLFTSLFKYGRLPGHISQKSKIERLLHKVKKFFNPVS